MPEMRARIIDLKEQLDQERTASTELRRIVTALAQRIRELETSQDLPGVPQSAGAGPVIGRRPRLAETALRRAHRDPGR